MSSDPQPAVRLIQRRHSQDGNLVVVRRLGREAKTPFADIFHWLMNRSWWQLIAIIFAGFVVANILYAGIYLLLPDAISNAKPGSFWDYYFFSVQTMATIGYGSMVPRTWNANLVASTEAFVGLLGFAIASGLLLARFAKPTSKILFSQVAVVSTRDGKKVLTMRLANERDNQILEGSVSLTYLHTIQTNEGESLRRFLDMRLERSRTPVFALTWTVLHPLDEASPLYGKNEEDMRREQAEILITFRGIDETFSQEIFARYSYMANEIRWNERFVDILGVSPEGERTIDYSKFHQTQPWAF